MATLAVKTTAMEPNVADDPMIVPLPNDFMNFYPWACGQFQMGVNVIINKMIQTDVNDGTVAAGKFQLAKKLRGIRNVIKAHMSVMNIESQKEVLNYTYESFTSDPIVKINAICNHTDRLIQLKFERTSILLPRGMLVILQLIAQFNTHLTSISFKNNITALAIYELSKLAEVSSITEIYLDGCYVREGNYAVLLDEKCELKILSLARCTLTDSIVLTIAEKLHYFQESGKHLRILNLSSNKITDVGAKSLALALRSNRQLCHLNLSDNFITDDGAYAILDKLTDFPITEDERIASRARRFKYISEKIELVNHLIEKLTDEYREKALKRKSTKSLKGIKSKTRYEENKVSLDDIARIPDRANFLAVNTLGEFVDPFYPVTFQNGVAYTFGNNTLQSLNLAYNNLTVLSLRRVLKVMLYQEILNRKPKGIINLNIDGNLLPVYCEELSKINSIMQVANNSIKLSKKRMF